MEKKKWYKFGSDKDKKQQEEHEYSAQNEPWEELNKHAVEKFKMPENFYKRVMDMEKEIERHRENSDEATIRTLI